MEKAIGPGTRIRFTAGNGTVRYGTVIEWFEPTRKWFVDIEPMKVGTGAATWTMHGFRTWFDQDQLDVVVPEEELTRYGEKASDFTARFRTQRALWAEWGLQVGDNARSALLAAFVESEVARNRKGEESP